MKPWTDPEVLDQVATFYDGLDEASADLFDAAVERLAELGPTLGRQTVGEIDLTHDEARSVFGNKLKELRAGTIRVLFTFGPDRVPVLLFAGDKTGEGSKWYAAAIRAAARAYRVYLEDLGPS